VEGRFDLTPDGHPSPDAFAALQRALMDLEPSPTDRLVDRCKLRLPRHEARECSLAPFFAERCDLREPHVLVFSDRLGCSILHGRN
jgi:hypothetical protein